MKDAGARGDVALVAENVGFGYDDRELIAGVSFEVRRGEIFVIAAAAASGITTLLKLCAGLLEPREGTVELFGRMARHPAVGFVFQRWGLLSNLSAFENVALPLRYHTRLSKTEISRRVEEALARAGVTEMAAQRPSEMSPSVVKRVQLARALVTEPDVLFLDMLTEGLDEAGGRGLWGLVEQARQQHGMTVVAGVHVIGCECNAATRMAVLAGGRLIACGTLDELRRRQDPKVVSIVGAG